MIFTILLTAFTLWFLFFVFLKPIWDARAAARRRGISRYPSATIRSSPTLDDSESFYHTEVKAKRTDTPGSREQINYLENNY